MRTSSTLRNLVLGVAVLGSVEAASKKSCCEYLGDSLGAKVGLPDSVIYNISVGTYWTSIAEAIRPSCVIAAQSPLDVSKAVSVLTAQECKFAVRSGGHSPWGSSAIENGVVIDLSAFKEVTVSDDRKVTRLGPGNRWAEVYHKLDAMGLAVPGGRVAGVGVGGLIMGGGVSFFSPKTGFVCDSVVNFEVVLSSGEVVNANATENSDLFKGLKGSGNNLGIVTAFDIKTFEQGKFWGGFVATGISAIDEMLKTFTKFATSPIYDSHAAVIQTYAYLPTPQQGFPAGWMIMNALQYTDTVVKSQETQSVAEVFKPFVEMQPLLFSTVRVTNLTDFTIEMDMGNARGMRKAFMTTTFVVDEKLMKDLFLLANETFPALDDMEGLMVPLVFQPLPKTFTKWGDMNGGNVMGLDGSEDLMLALVPVSWMNESDDERVINTVNDFLAKANALAEKRGLARPYRYLNYSYKNQDPIESYGVKNVAFLKKLSEKYDKTQTFQRLVPGGHKLIGLGEENVTKKDEL